MYFINCWYSDLMILSEILDEVEFYSGTDRKNMLKRAGYEKDKDSGSMLFGVTWRSWLSKTKSRTYDKETGLYRTKVYDNYPYLKDVFKEFSKLYFPDFKWSQIQLNKNFKCPPHRDSANVGESILVSCGDYIGGLTAVDIDGKIEKFDSRERPFKFDGSKYLHWVEPYKGKRYSLVFFNKNDKVAKKNKVKG